MTARIISVARPSARKGIVPGCTDYRHSKFVRRRQYVETVLLPQMAALMRTDLFDAVTDENFIVDRGSVLYGDSRIKVNEGNTGNFLSHLCLWRQMTDSPILVLEDDAELPPENAGNVMGALRLFESCPGPAVLHLLSAMPWSEHGTKDFGDVIPIGGLLKVIRTSDLSGTAAYAVNPLGAAVLYHAALRDGTRPTDGFIHRAFNQGELAVFVPDRHRECFMLHEHWAEWNHVHEGTE